ncbi:MAG: glycosyltransferase family 9 protein [Gammaproteobacteria bacterium]|nr:glycosyltransferase family 9 protein [Gammaproteobacteria bacterium]MBU1980671.1 glycosyltransferase family 9 protein [Gammaproteobacteria bacterium]
MSSRFPVRLHIVVAALWHSLLTLGQRHRPRDVCRILVTHHPQMLGDTLLLTPLLAKLRASYPTAEILLTASPVTAPLYQKQPYGVKALAYDPRNHRSLRALFQLRGFDLAIVPGDNRYSWLARALGARWVAGFAGDRPASKNWLMDQLTPYPDTPATWGEMAAALVDGPPPAPYKTADWPMPDCRPFALPTQPYCVLHVGASTVLKLWSPEKWRSLAEFLTKCGLQIVWSGGPGEQRIVDEIDPDKKHLSFAGQLDLAQLWHLLAHARLLVCPDTGAAHLGRIVGTPTVTLFGPGSPVLCGAGEFWRNSPYRAVTVANFPCRDQRVFFRRTISWVRRCGRNQRECVAVGACMDGIQVTDVRQAIEELGIRE